MNICRECGFMKSDKYIECPDCKVKLEEFEGYEEPLTKEEINMEEERSKVDLNKDFEEIRKLLSEGGSRFDYIFDALKSINIGIKNNSKGYIEQKLETLQRATDMIKHDVPILLDRRNKKNVDVAQEN